MVSETVLWDHCGVIQGMFDSVIRNIAFHQFVPVAGTQFVRQLPILRAPTLLLHVSQLALSALPAIAAVNASPRMTALFGAIIVILLFMCMLYKVGWLIYNTVREYAPSIVTYV